MSEYWVSKKKYFCKYCEIYITDDAPSRQQHENGLRHKGNVERFVCGIYKTGEKQKRTERTKRGTCNKSNGCVVTLTSYFTLLTTESKAAAAAFAQDIGSGLAKPNISRPGPSASSAAAVKPTQKR